VLGAFRHAVAPRWLCEACTTLVPVTGAAIAEMIDANRLQTVCATDDVSEALETLQFTLGEGPCVQAVSTGRPVLVSDLREVRPTRWPRFAEAANQTPARAVYSFPLRIGVINMGMLDLYRDQPGPLTDAELAGACCALTSRCGRCSVAAPAPTPTWRRRSGVWTCTRWRSTRPPAW
jgi:GAF domain-containing protein